MQKLWGLNFCWHYQDCYRNKTRNTVEYEILLLTTTTIIIIFTSCNDNNNKRHTGLIILVQSSSWHCVLRKEKKKKRQIKERVGFIHFLLVSDFRVDIWFIYTWGASLVLLIFLKCVTYNVRLPQAASNPFGWSTVTEEFYTICIYFRFISKIIVRIIRLHKHRM